MKDPVGQCYTEQKGKDTHENICVRGIDLGRLLA